MVTLNDHTVPSEHQQQLNNKRPLVEVEPLLEVDGDRKRKKLRRVNFNLTIDIKQDDACVPQGPHSLSDFSDVESLAEPIPTTPGGKPQVRPRFCCGLGLIDTFALIHYKYKVFQRVNLHLLD